MIPPLLLGRGQSSEVPLLSIRGALGQAPCSGFISVAMTKYPDQKHHGKKTWLAISHHEYSQGKNLMSDLLPVPHSVTSNYGIQFPATVEQEPARILLAGQQADMPQAHRDPSAPACRVLGLQACSPTPIHSLCCNYNPSTHSLFIFKVSFIYVYKCFACMHVHQVHA